MSKFVSLFIIASFFSTVCLFGQNFKWAHGGGTIHTFSTSYQSEQTKFMCTDRNGNVYALNEVGNDPITADTFHGLPYGGTQNILVTSYNCSGQMRWAKLLASSGGDCLPFGITADSLGHVYIAGSFDGGGSVFHIGGDTTIAPPASNYLMKAVIQLDTSGHFKWIRYVGANTFASAVAMGSLADPIALDGANNIHFFCYIQATGIPFAPSYTSVYGVYDVAYNTAGTMLGATRLDLDSQWYLRGTVIDPTTNKLYACGEVNQSFGLGIDTFFAAAFDVSRSKLWQYHCGHGGDDGIVGIAMDPAKYLYFCGNAQPVSGEPTFSFNGDSVSAPFNNIAIVMKTDTNGSVNWIKHYDSHTSENALISITCLPNNKVAAAGGFLGTVTDGTITLSTSPTSSDNPYFVILDSGGHLETMKQVYANAGNIANVIVADRVGNLYIGGQVGDSIWGGSIPAYHTVGGNTDFFVIKYGVDCSCTSMPIAAYTDTGMHTVGFTYTGTTTGIDSVVWDFGDGNTGTGIAPFHTYTASGTYHVCATVYTDCGSDIHCSDVVVVVGTTGISGFSLADIQVYPNPVKDDLHIAGVPQNTNYRILNVTGECVMQGRLSAGSSVTSTHALSAGVYILEMTDTDGVRNMVRVVKQ